MSSKLIDELRRLDAVATKGTWRACQANKEKEGICPCMSLFAYETEPPHRDMGVLMTASVDGAGDPDATWKDMKMEDRKEALANLELSALIGTHRAHILAMLEAGEKLAEAASHARFADGTYAGCGCERCKPETPRTRMVVCSICGNKRCPRANDHRNLCTHSNDTGQVGLIEALSAYDRVKGGNDGN